MATAEQIRNWFRNNQGASDEQIFGAMQQHNINPSDLASAMNINSTDVNRRIAAVNPNNLRYSTEMGGWVSPTQLSNNTSQDFGGGKTLHSAIPFTNENTQSSTTTYNDQGSVFDGINMGTTTEQTGSTTSYKNVNVPQGVYQGQPQSNQWWNQFVTNPQKQNRDVSSAQHTQGNVMDRLSQYGNQMVQQSQEGTPLTGQDVQTYWNNMGDIRDKYINYMDQHGGYDPMMLSDRTNQLTDQNSDYVQLARQQAAEQAASRGLLNTSMAAGAGQRAAIQSALDLARGDVDATNRAREFEAQAKQQFGTDASRNALGVLGDEMSTRMQDFTQEKAFQRQQADKARSTMMDIGSTSAKTDISNWLAEQDWRRGIDTATASAVIEDRLADNAAIRGDTIALNEANRQLTLIQEEYGLKKDMVLSEAELDNAGGIMSMYLQAAAQISSSDLSAEDKGNQISALWGRIQGARSYLARLGG